MVTDGWLLRVAKRGGRPEWGQLGCRHESCIVMGEVADLKVISAPNRNANIWSLVSQESSHSHGKVEVLGPHRNHRV
ncbi:hypothetical protein JTE90_021592 [Oedothorax gibbosus]|uniref:Uncharacterized protein n=1 Tax=Oedothorax gibbosus TaxID=931172 RepID=A0AAV6VNY3_9ARAC|nr:hypothetical protein JTE90_021592 [Oedothorax gibbosus]